ncbi:hypothetical protein PROFUN_05986 [Planoprotostelium fungivorum]|uniref:Uncharacterized protein n=1 Tax=Planoprotostelium fungivorum TaxID=1890364 RepID=A0A2P6NPB3_9EUKA|nr:hypothetical protein PROFUN_05986 [Planoprotostelium fungivorum]
MSEADAARIRREKILAAKDKRLKYIFNEVETPKLSAEEEERAKLAAALAEREATSMNTSDPHDEVAGGGLMGTNERTAVSSRSTWDDFNRTITAVMLAFVLGFTSLYDSHSGFVITLALIFALTTVEYIFWFVKTGISPNLIEVGKLIIFNGKKIFNDFIVTIISFLAAVAIRHAL